MERLPERSILASNDANAFGIFLYVSWRRYDYDHRLMMYSKLKGVSTRERFLSAEGCGVWMRCTHLRARDGVRTGALSRFMFFTSISMGIGRDTLVV